MNPLRRRILLQALKLLDVVIAAIAFLVGGAVTRPGFTHPPLDGILAQQLTVSSALWFAAFLVAWSWSLAALGLYRSKRLTSRRDRARDVVRATSSATIVLLVADLVFAFAIIDAPFLLMFWTTATGLTLAGRFLLMGTLEVARRRGRNLRNLLIVGINPRTIRFAQYVETRPDFGYRLIGFVDEEREVPALPSGARRVAGLEDFPGFLRTHVVDEVVIGLPMKSLYSQAAGISAACEEQGLLARFLRDIFERGDRGEASGSEEDWTVDVSFDRRDGMSVVLKRLLDVAVAAALLAVLAPILLVIGVVIVLSSSGPAIFVQERVGLSKRTFGLFKFRTMVHDAEDRIDELEHLNEAEGPVFKIKDDPRVTPFGRFLRRTSLDELPQLFNVLRGDMSLVGPRPLPLRDCGRFEEDWQRRRFSVRPGITCLWQVNGRSGVAFDQWMQLDMQYIDEWSLLLDLKILVLTVPAVVKGTGAV